MYARRIPPLNGKRARELARVPQLFRRRTTASGFPGGPRSMCAHVCDSVIVYARAHAHSLPLSPQPRDVFRVSDEKRKKFYKIPIESALKVNVFIRNWPTNEPTTECWIIVFAIRCNLPRESSSMFNERNERVWSELEQ